MLYAPLHKFQREKLDYQVINNSFPEKIKSHHFPQAMRIEESGM